MSTSPLETRVVSTDTMVWLSLFDTGAGYIPPEVEQTRPRLPRLPIPSWIGPNAGLWDAFGPYLGPVQPPACGRAWQQVGFDVSDGSLLSGLSNCGYVGRESETFRARWRGHLNEHHLFTELAPAGCFVERLLPFCWLGEPGRYLTPAAHPLAHAFHQDIERGD